MREAARQTALAGQSGQVGWGSDFGGWLRRERESRGIPLIDVSQRTRIRLHYLELIEKNDVEELPAEVFLRGFVRSYARAIGADEKQASQLLSAHLLERGTRRDDDGEGVLRHRMTGGLRTHLGTLLGLLALGAAVALLVMLFLRR